MNREPPGEGSSVLSDDEIEDLYEPDESIKEFLVTPFHASVCIESLLLIDGASSASGRESKP